MFINQLFHLTSAYIGFIFSKKFDRVPWALEGVSVQNTSGKDLGHWNCSSLAAGPWNP